MRTKQIINFALMLVVVVSLIGGMSTPAKAQPSLEISRDSVYVPGEVLVSFEEGAAPDAISAQAAALAGTVGAQVVDQYDNMALLSFAEDADVAGLAAQLSGQASVAYAEPNYISWIPEEDPRGQDVTVTEVKRNNLSIAPDTTGAASRESLTGASALTQASADSTKVMKQEKITIEDLRAMRTLRSVDGKVQAVPTYPNDSYQWDWWRIYTNFIWPNANASPIVCVVDTGIDYKHPDLNGKALNGRDFVNDDAVANDDHGHGTHVAGTIAAKWNNTKGMAGISNGKVLGVKVLAAQGWGTSFDIAAGIRYCAGYPGVKVINMSLGGGSASTAEYDALAYAVNTKGKFVATAAGNSGAAYYSYPAAWSAPWVCRDGSSSYPSACGSNTISSGMVAVGAGRSPYSTTDDTNGDGYLWIDTNGDGVRNDVDNNVDACATDFSNFGKWVEIVAPGEDIYSTLPTSYPFYESYFYSQPTSGYASWNGTSMASPHVAGAAARLWSIHSTWTPAQIKTQLIASGDVLYTNMDPNTSAIVYGYNGGSNGYKGEAPFCWPNSSKGTFYDMSGSRYLNLASAMERGGISLSAAEAVSGLPLVGAKLQVWYGSTVKDTALITDKTSRWVDLINLPMISTGYYDFKLSKAGYTYGTVKFGRYNAVYPSQYLFPPLGNVAVGPMNRIQAVLNFDLTSNAEDLYVFIPLSTAGGGVVGSGYSGSPYDVGAGDLSGWPQARWNRDGGFGDWLYIQSISIAARPGYPTMPYYNSKSNAYYDFYATDYRNGSLPSNFSIFRLWVGGKVVGAANNTANLASGFTTYNFDAYMGGCDYDGADNIAGNIDDEYWWYIGFMNNGKFYQTGECGSKQLLGTGHGVWPYAEVGSATTLIGPR